MKQTLTYLCVFLFMIPTILYGQDIRISGRVTDSSDGSTIPGASIQVKGTTIGTSTNLDGEYVLNAPSNATLIFSFLGMTTQIGRASCWESV